MDDGWGPEPNPVTHIIRTRTLQVGGGSVLALAALGTVLPPEQFWPLVPWGGGLVTTGLSTYFAATFHPRSALGAPLLSRLPERAGEAVALTFDDGPHPETTPRLLDLLGEAGARGTLFFVGQRASAYPHLVRRAWEEGHTLGVHGLRHRTMVLQSVGEIERDLAEAQKRIEDAAGAVLPTKLLRPPYMFTTWTLGRVVQRLGWTMVSWSVDTRDYDPYPPEALVARVTKRLATRDIVLAHERPGNPTMLAALPGILGFCQNRGWQCVGLEPTQLDPPQSLSVFRKR